MKTSNRMQGVDCPDCEDGTTHRHIKPLRFPTNDIAKPVTEAIAIRHTSPKLNKHERRKLRNMAYHTIKTNSPGVSKGLIKQAAFTRSKAGFAAMEAIEHCLSCGNQVLRSSLTNQLCVQCLPIE